MSLNCCNRDESGACGLMDQKLHHFHHDQFEWLDYVGIIQITLVQIEQRPLHCHHVHFMQWISLYSFCWFVIENLWLEGLYRFISYLPSLPLERWQHQFHLGCCIILQPKLSKHISMKSGSWLLFSSTHLSNDIPGQWNKFAIFFGPDSIRWPRMKLCLCKRYFFKWSKLNIAALKAEDFDD